MDGCGSIKTAKLPIFGFQPYRADLGESFFCWSGAHAWLTR